MKKTLCLIIAIFVAGITLTNHQSIFAKETNPDHKKLFAGTDARTLAAQYIKYFKTIPLTYEQNKIKDEALTPIPAPCCKDNSIKTCCCPCNLAKSVWGLSHYLIARKNYGAEQVRGAVEEYIRFVNPAGYSGDSCYKGRCKLPFNQNGCGGMDDRKIQ